MTRSYIRPLGLLSGEDAAAAAACGQAGQIAGGIIAFTAVELIEREAGRVKRRQLTYADIARTREQELRSLLARIEAPRRAVAGLTFAQPTVMGVINVTPDSFSDGGETVDMERAVASGVRMVEEGASILDVGGESTRPGSEGISADEERRRVIPVIEELHRRGLTLSVDTRKPHIMAAAVNAGAAIINDISALRFDPQSAETAARLGRPVVLMHAKGDPKTMQANPVYDEVVLDVYDFLSDALAKAESAGIARALLLADPGIGFGKTFRHNVEILHSLAIYHGLGVPLVVGASRKAFIGALTGVKAAKYRGAGSLGAAIAAASQGAQILRVHDVRETVQALKVWQAIMVPGESRL